MKGKIDSMAEKRNFAGRTEILNWKCHDIFPDTGTI